jgi:hypothetical protein
LRAGRGTWEGGAGPRKKYVEEIPHLEDNGAAKLYTQKGEDPSTMFKVPHASNPVNESLPAGLTPTANDESSPRSGSVPEYPGQKSYLQNIPFEIGEEFHKAFIFNIKNELNSKNELPFTVVNLKDKVEHLPIDGNIVIKFEVDGNKLVFIIPKYKIVHSNFDMPYLLIPRDAFNCDNITRIKAFKLIINTQEYNVIWNIIYRANDDYIIVVPVSLISINLKFKKKPPKNYKIHIKKYVYFISCQVISTDSDARYYIPEFLVPRKKCPIYVYFHLAVKRVISEELGCAMSYAKLAALAKDLFGVDISPSTVSRATRNLLGQIQAEAPQAGEEAGPGGAEPVGAPAVDKAGSEPARCALPPGLEGFRDCRSAIVSCGPFMRGWLLRHGKIFGVSENTKSCRVRACYPP